MIESNIYPNLLVSPPNINFKSNEMKYTSILTCVLVPPQKNMYAPFSNWFGTSLLAVIEITPLPEPNLPASALLQPRSLPSFACTLSLSGSSTINRGWYKLINILTKEIMTQGVLTDLNQPRGEVDLTVDFHNYTPEHLMVIDLMFRPYPPSIE